MNKPSRMLEWLVWGGLGITVLVIVLAFGLSSSRTQQPKLPILFPVPDFTLTNQLGQPFGLSDLRGHVWVANIIFTKCGGPCPRSSARMAELQAALPPGSGVKLVTLTTDPEYDTPAILAAYSRRFQAQSDRWHFLTGIKRQIAEVAVRGLKMTALDKEPAQMESATDLFIHSTILVVVDKRGQVRASIETEPGEGEAPINVNGKILPILDQLLQEP